jgi:hypothetical protein
MIFTVMYVRFLKSINRIRLFYRQASLQLISGLREADGR